MRPAGDFFFIQLSNTRERKAGIDLPRNRYLIVFDDFVCHNTVLLPLWVFCLY